jgi:hypothetical protein
MLENAPGRFVKLATVGDLTTGRVLAARLLSEGIEVRVHSPALGPYPVTVGHMAETELWVMNDRVEEASRILLDAEVNAALSPVETPTARQGPALELRVVALVVAAVLVILWVLRIIRVF